MIALLGTVLATSLLGSPHCAAMCGGFVSFYATSPGGRRARAHAAYNVGRLISYLVLGALAGTLGAGLDRLGAAAGIARAAAVASGVLLIVWGGARLLAALGARVPDLAAEGFARRAIGRVLRAFAHRSAPARALAIGLVTTLLPCGFLYAYVAVAAGTGSPLGGALAMAVFWLGTVPVMAGLGLAAGRLLDPLGRRLPVVTASALLVIGAFTVAGKFAPIDHAAHVRAPGAAHAHHAMPVKGR